MDTCSTRLKRKYEASCSLQPSSKSGYFSPQGFPFLAKMGTSVTPCSQQSETQRNTIYHKKYMTKNQQLVTSLCLIILKTCHQTVVFWVDTMQTSRWIATFQKKMQPPSVVQEEQAMWKRNEYYIRDIQDMWLEYSPFLFGKLIFTRCWA